MSNSLSAISSFPDYVTGTLFNQIYKIDSLIFDLNDKVNSILFSPVTISGPLFISNTTNCDCSGVTGSLIVAGGTSIDLDLCVGGRTLVGNGSMTTPSLSFCNAQGSGLYYPGNGNSLNIACNGADIAQFTCSPPNVNFISTVNILDPASTQADCNGNGSLRTNGGVFVNKNIVGNEQIYMADGIATIPSYTFCSNPTTGIFSNAGIPNQLSISAGGIDTVDITPNNVSINGNEVVTGTITVQSNLVATCIPFLQGALSVFGGVAVGGNLCVNGPVTLAGPVTITSLLPCNCNGTAALVIDGGISALQNICLSTINNSRIFNANGSAVAPSYTFCNFPGNGMFSLSTTSLSFSVNSVDIIDVNQGAPNLVSINGSATVNSGINNTLCTPASGALQVTGTGGLGVGGNATIGGDICINGSETINSGINNTLCTPASGALQITGTGGLGVGGNATIGGSLCVNGSETINSGINNTLCTPASGALQITGTGGLGVGGNATIGGDLCVNGNITTGGDISITTAGDGLEIKEGGATARMGTATLVAGTVTVVNTSTTANTRIFAFGLTPIGVPGALFLSAITLGATFTINSTSGGDNSIISWLLIEAL